jgi:hypothetical protein
MKLRDLEDAFLFVGGASIGECTAMINRRTGEMLFHSALTDLDELPEEIYESEDWLEVPHKNELGLGRELAMSFVMQRLFDDIDRVRRIFSRPRAYAYFKELLDERGVLQEWYTFEDGCMKEAIRQWGDTVGLDVTE